MGKRRNVLFVLEENVDNEEPTTPQWNDRTDPAPSATIIGSALRQPAGLRGQPSKQPTVEANKLRRARQNKAAVAKIELVARARHRPPSRARSLASLVFDQPSMTFVLPTQHDAAKRECLFLLLLAGLLFVAKDLIQVDALLDSLRYLQANAPELVATARTILSL